MSAPSSESDAAPGGARAANRLAGLAVAGFAALLWFVVIPAEVDSAGYGWMRPRTLPLVCAGALGLFGLLLAAFPGGKVDLAPRRSLRVAGLFALSAAALWAMGQWGFPVTAPALAAALALFLRETRWPWIVAAVACVPATIWLIVTVVLGRNLP